MNKYDSCHEIILELWNEFAQKYNYPKQEKISGKVRRKLNSRLKIDSAFLRNFPDLLLLIHNNCKTNEFGDPLDFFQFMRATVYLKALSIRDALRAEENDD